jgi:hypothetical protein
MASEDFDMMVEVAAAAARCALPGIYSLFSFFFCSWDQGGHEAGDRDLVWLFLLRWLFEESRELGG